MSQSPAQQKCLHAPIIIKLNDAKPEDPKQEVINCSCGVKCGPQKLYFYHLESAINDEKDIPKDVSQWPLRLLRTVPKMNLAQRGAIARNSFNYVQYSQLWLSRNENTKTIEFPDQDSSKFRHFLASIPLSYHSKNDCVVLIAFSHQFWSQMIEIQNKMVKESKNNSKNETLKKPDELRQFVNKKSYDNKDKNDSKTDFATLLPLYNENYISNDKNLSKLDKSIINHLISNQSDIYFFVKSNDRKICSKITKDLVSKFNKFTKILHSESVSSFKYRDGRDLTGFIDGTKNSDYNLRLLKDVSVNNEGGSYIYCSRYIHALNKFDQLNTTQKSHIIGRSFDPQKERKTKGLDGRMENPRTGGDLSGHIFKSWGEMV